MELSKNYKIVFDEMDWIEVGDGMRFKRIQQGDMQVRLVEWDKAMVHPNWCLKGHIGYITEGDVEIDIAGKVYRYGVGDVFILPDGEEHKHRPKVLSEKVRFFAVEKIS
ncbi:cupin domain-containing protein [Zwartia panacis]|uniref:cupin domain-containing protein n=1 Tax=Zwartia panacis TaxID=2683345 RepID=UPI0025B5012B|nr:cupin domain-containing protein [Zwartia panacis]MDN4018399.1 cupin domain-containing protein [Zwartia panacis]